jgi:TrmH family RNA methyltransferase
MANMGLRDLVLVAPKHPLDHPDTIAYATHGRPVLDNAQVFDRLESALADCVRTYATSAKHGLYRRQNVITPEAAARDAFPLTQQDRVALAFGPEAYGFKTAELLLFDRIVSIPADDAFPVMNLAAAVTVVCYELRRTFCQAAAEPKLPHAIDFPRAPDQRKQILFQKLFDALERIDFFSEQSPDKLKYALRHLFGRMELTVHEADVLIGMAQQMRWFADQHAPRTDNEDSKDA